MLLPCISIFYMLIRRNVIFSSPQWFLMASEETHTLMGQNVVIMD